MRRISGFSIILLAAVVSVLWLDSCRKHKIEVVQQQEAMTFGISSRGTKALIGSKEALVVNSYNSGTGFGVYGYKRTEVAGSEPTYYLNFDNIEVLPNSADENTTWHYSPTRYWDSNSNVSYQFIAYWPHFRKQNESGSGPYASEGSGTFYIHDFPCWQDCSSASCADLMTDIRRGSYSAGLFTDQNQIQSSKVQFTFSHVLAKLTIRAYYIGLKTNHIKVTGLRLTNGGDTEKRILSSDGTVEYSQLFRGGSGLPTFKAANNQTEPLGTTAHVLYSSNQGLELPETTWDDEDQDDTDHTYQEICTWLMIPCSGWEDLGLAVDYSIGGTATIPSNISGLTIRTNINNEERTQTASGKSYILTLKFDSKGGSIDLESVLIKNWSVQEIETGVYNW